MSILRAFVRWWVWWGRNSFYYYSRPPVWFYRGWRWLWPFIRDIDYYFGAESKESLEQRTNGMYKWAGGGWRLDTDSDEFARQLAKLRKQVHRL